MGALRIRPTSPLLTVKVVIAILRFVELSRPQRTPNEFLIYLNVLINKSIVYNGGSLSSLIAGLVSAFIRICRHFFNAIMTSQGRLGSCVFVARVRWGEEGCVTCDVRTPQPHACETAGRQQRRRDRIPRPAPRQSAAGRRAPCPPAQPVRSVSRAPRVYPSDVDL